MKMLFLGLLALVAASCRKERLGSTKPSSLYVESHYGKVLKIQDQCNTDAGSPCIIELSNFSSTAPGGKVAAVGYLSDSLQSKLIKGAKVRIDFTPVCDYKWFNLYCADFVRLPPLVYITDCVILP